MSARNRQIVLDLLRNENLSGNEIAKRSGLSQPTVSRILSSEKSVVKLGQTRNTVFANYHADHELYQVDEMGDIHTIGNYYQLADRVRSVVQQNKNYQQFDGLPFYLYDLTPAGFLGSIEMQRLNKLDASVPASLRDLTDETILYYLTHYGHDLPGNLIVGRNMAEKDSLSETTSLSREDYDAFAEGTLDEYPVGSSVGGEQPKFTCFDGNNHLLVKFSPVDADNNPVATRVRDLLICEHLALQVLTEHGIDAAESNLYQSDRFYLEVKRFDRVGQYGRKGMVSLEKLCSEFVGKQDRWIDVVSELVKQNLVSEQDLRTTELIQAFGQRIGNTDMHNGNLSFFFEDLNIQGLCPVYDMLPMSLMPIKGEVRNNLKLPRMIGGSKEVIETASTMAKIYWEQVLDHAEISDSFKKIVHVTNLL